MLNVYWEPGLNNLADYPTKHHSGTHHKAVRSIYLYEVDSPRTVKGCIELLNYEKRSKTKLSTTTGETTTGRSGSGSESSSGSKIDLYDPNRNPAHRNLESHYNSAHRNPESGKALSAHRPIRKWPRLDNHIPHSQSRKTQSKRQSRLTKRSSYNCGQLYSDPINQPLKQ